jgi:hypothetical protein
MRIAAIPAAAQIAVAAIPVIIVVGVRVVIVVGRQAVAKAHAGQAQPNTEASPPETMMEPAEAWAKDRGTTKAYTTAGDETASSEPPISKAAAESRTGEAAAAKSAAETPATNSTAKSATAECMATAEPMATKFLRVCRGYRTASDK